MFEFDHLNQSEVLKCQYRVLGIYVGRKLTATRAITFGEDNHSFALTKVVATVTIIWRYTAANTEERYTSTGTNCCGGHATGCTGTCQSHSWTHFAPLHCCLVIDSFTAQRLVATWSSDRSYSQLPFTICRELNTFISRRITEVNKVGWGRGQMGRQKQKRRAEENKI